MTRASASRIARRRRGRERRDYRDDEDLIVAETAIALQAAWNLSERRAIDLALALHQAYAGRPSKIPRGGKAGALIGYTLADQKSFHSRNHDIRRKLEAGKLLPDAQVIRAIAQLLHKIHTRRF